MAIGYACLTLGVPETKFRTCRKNRATAETLKSLIQSNLHSLNRIFDYNIRNNIKLFRMSSDIIPFGSHPVNELDWWNIFSEELHALGEKAIKAGMRLSMHPGQYTVLNSNNPEVVSRAIDDLTYHCRFMDALGLDSSHKIILHIGGAYGNKAEAIERFKANYRALSDPIKARLVIENDDKIYRIQEVFKIGLDLDIPVVYDNLHNQVNPYDHHSDLYWIEAVNGTWRQEDGPQKIHYSQQNKDKKPGSHSETIDLEEFLDFYHEISNREIDIMLEVKDKNLSAIKCINGLNERHIKVLEREWARYKYLVLEHSPRIYTKIRDLLRDKSSYPVVDFYALIDEALDQEIEAGHAINAGQHIWGYFKDLASEKDRQNFEKAIDKLKAGGSTRAMKRQLWTLARENNEEYLLNSLYFKELM